MFLIGSLRAYLLRNWSAIINSVIAVIDFKKIIDKAQLVVQKILLLLLEI